MVMILPIEREARRGRKRSAIDEAHDGFILQADQAK